MIDFKDLAGLGITGIIIMAFFVLLGGLPVAPLLCLVALTVLAIIFGQNE